ncbi:EF-hand domain-containing protein [Nitrospira sp. KM1]|uniref:EF-hand domain-containing protein n=1 Tax=Nitrospira sp. KM1 TaxID=1936990 RepID=UPI00156646DE|nr:EF-hand domain-containing protein [Nitrospira sp. KM1]
MSSATVFLTCLAVSSSWGVQASAYGEKSAQALSPRDRPSASQPPVRPESPASSARMPKLSVTAPQHIATGALAIPKSPARPVKKARSSMRSKKSIGKGHGKAVSQPNTHDAYYGLLADRQHYDPRPRSQRAGFPHPRAADLSYDYFQELDRNRDGRIDSMERAVSRLDIDRDLETRR